MTQCGKLHQLRTSIRPYLVSLIIYRKPPPILNGRIDWMSIGQTCGIEDELTAELQKRLRPGLDAMIRSLGTPPADEDVQPAKPAARVGKTTLGKRATAASPSCASGFQ